MVAHGGSGTSTAALAVSAKVAWISLIANVTEKWDGSSWTETA